MSEKVSGALQENLLHLLAFSVKTAPLIRNAVDAELFSSPLFREIIHRVYDFLDRHKQPPADHFPDLLEDLLKQKGAEGELVERVVSTVMDLHGKVNEKYVIEQLERFVRAQRLKAALIKAGELAQEGDIDGAEIELEKRRAPLKLFSPGMTLTEGWQAALRGDIRTDVISTGIPELDKWGLGPARGELHLFIAPAKRGKSWWLINVAKRALLARLRVLYVTLELSEKQILQRFLQSIFGLQRHKARLSLTHLEKDELGRFVKFETSEAHNVRALFDTHSHKYVEERLAMFRMRNNLLVKNFPTGMLGVAGLRAYLDGLERMHNFMPDVVLLDYPDLMEIDRKQLREALGALFIDLRGLAVERNIVMPVVTQSNRSGASAKLMMETDVGEDWSKIATADTVLTFSQTMAEKELNLARLFVANSRVSEHDRFVVLMSQSYQVGQFCRESSLMTDSYWKALGGGKEEE